MWIVHVIRMVLVLIQSVLSHANATLVSVVTDLHVLMMMNAKMVPTTVIPTVAAPTLAVVSLAHVTLDILEMVLPVKTSMNAKVKMNVTQMLLALITMEATIALVMLATMETELTALIMTNALLSVHVIKMLLVSLALAVSFVLVKFVMPTLLVMIFLPLEAILLTSTSALHLTNAMLTQLAQTMMVVTHAFATQVILVMEKHALILTNVSQKQTTVMAMHCAQIMSDHFHALAILVTPVMALTVLMTTNVLTNLVATILSAPIFQVLLHATAPLDMKEMPSQDALILTNVQLRPMSVIQMLHV